MSEYVFWIIKRQEECQQVCEVCYSTGDLSVVLASVCMLLCRDGAFPYAQEHLCIPVPSQTLAFDLCTVNKLGGPSPLLRGGCSINNLLKQCQFVICQTTTFHFAPVHHYWTWAQRSHQHFWNMFMAVVTITFRWDYKSTQWFLLQRHVWCDLLKSPKIKDWSCSLFANNKFDQL